MTAPTEVPERSVEMAPPALADAAAAPGVPVSSEGEEDSLARTSRRRLAEVDGTMAVGGVDGDADADGKEEDDMDGELLEDQSFDTGLKMESDGVGVFTWVLYPWSEISREDKKQSPAFEVGGASWNVLLFPRGNGPQHRDAISAFLKLSKDDLPEKWYKHAQLRLAIVDQKAPSSKRSFTKETNHFFDSYDGDWGFNTLAPLRDVNDPSKNFCVKDSVVLTCKVDTVKPPPNGKADYIRYDSRDETGYVGLKNQGATCYMNSLLQVLFHLKSFRNSVYSIPIDLSPPSGSPQMALALQKLFVQLEQSPSPVSTRELTRSFGWESYESFMQHDVQELNRVLCEKLEEKMKTAKSENHENSKPANHEDALTEDSPPPPPSNPIEKLFQGYLMNFIECIDVDYKSRRRESFMDLQLDVKGCADIYDSLKKYVAVETLDGENKYAAGDYGLQPARKGCKFERFPPILQLQLKRFEYDFHHDTMVKINDKYCFPDELDLSKFLEPGENGVHENGDNKYVLQSVFVHSGSMHGGHYYVYIQPTSDSWSSDVDSEEGNWYKFDDDKVTREVRKAAIDDQFGEENAYPKTLGLPVSTGPGMKVSKYSSAYMLTYIRKSQIKEILDQESSIPDALHEVIKKEEEEKEQRRREKEEAHLYVTVKIVTEQKLRDLIYADKDGVDENEVGMKEKPKRVFDLVGFEFEDVEGEKKKKDMTIRELKEELLNKLNLSGDTSQIRLWTWARRRNKTLRVDSPISDPDEKDTLDTWLKQNSQTMNSGMQSKDIRLFAEVLPPPNMRPKPSNFILFIKVYYPQEAVIRYGGYIFVSQSSRLKDYRAEICKIAGFKDSMPKPFLAYEEISYQPSLQCELVDQEHKTLAKQELESGDIIVVQEQLSNPSEVPFPTARSFLEHIKNLRTVILRRFDQPSKDVARIRLSKTSSYQQVAEAMAAKLNIAKGPDYLRIFQQIYSQGPHHTAHRHNEGNLESMLEYNRDPSVHGVLYFEEIDIQLQEFEKQKEFGKIIVVNSKMQEIGCHTVRVDSERTVADLIEVIREKANKSGKSSSENKEVIPADKKLRLVELSFYKVTKILSPTTPLKKLIVQESSYFRVEEEEEDDSKEEDGETKQALFSHYTEYSANTYSALSSVSFFGESFLMAVHAKDTVQDICDRIQKKLDVKDEEMEKWKFSLLTGAPLRAVSIDDKRSEKILDLVKQLCSPMSSISHSLHSFHIGLEHDSRGHRRSHSQSRTRHSNEKAIKINS